jgi:hypothetical protein
MVNLQESGIEQAATECAMRAKLFDQSFLDFLWYEFSSSLTGFQGGLQVKTIGGDYPPLRIRYLICFECDTVFANIPSGSGWVVIAILFFQLFRRNETVFYNVV